MGREYIIGRSASSAVKVPLDKNGVSGTHAKISIGDNGVWMLCDLDSTNGTYVSDDLGVFHRIYSKEISEDDIIRLGSGGASSFVFTAHRVLDDVDDYSYEFRQLRRRLAERRTSEAAMEKRMEIYDWLTRLSGLAAVGVCAILDALGKISVNANVRYMLIAFAPVVVGFFFRGNTKTLKKLRRCRERIFICPKCGKPLSEYDIEDGQCSRCRAK